MTNRLQEALKGTRPPPPNIERKLQLHLLWLASRRGRGKRADFSGEDLSWLQLNNRDLSQAIFDGANLSHADLRCTQLKGASLKKASLQEALLQEASLIGTELHGTIFHDSWLCNADLSDSVSLDSEALSGADLHGTSLQHGDLIEAGLIRARELSGSIRNITYVLIAALLYTAVTIGDTTDLRIVRDVSGLPLPILGARISVRGFYLVAPFLILAIYLYLLVHRVRLAEALMRLPGILPDGSRAIRKARLWVLARSVMPDYFRAPKRSDFVTTVERVTEFALTVMVTLGVLTWLIMAYLPGRIAGDVPISVEIRGAGVAG